MPHPYATDEYARSLGHIGAAFPVPEWGCNILIRRIADGLVDATGTYPIATIDSEADLAAGRARLREHGVVSVSLVLDDFHRPDIERLKKVFSFFRPYKTHYLRRMTGPPIDVTKHHRYYIRRALESVKARAFDLASHLSDWSLLYEDVAAKRHFKAIHKFGPEHFAELAKLDGVTAIGAWMGNELVSAHIWVRHEGLVHSHLAASNDRGYAVGAAYAVNFASLDHFSDARLINLGGSPDGSEIAEHGLSRFKRGFANDTAPSYLCGAILRAKEYEQLVRQHKIDEPADYFPAYRTPSQEVGEASWSRAEMDR